MSGLDDFFKGIEPVLFTLAPVVVPLLMAALTVVVRNFFEKMPSKQRATLASIIQTGVAAAEQTGFGKLNGAEKKLVAMQSIHAALAHFKLSVPDSVIDPMLEEAVLIFNIASGTDKKIPVPTQTPLITKDHE